MNYFLKKHKLALSLLLFIFLAAIAVRFLYFPDNVYFGYDQARDAYVSKGILNGHFKIKGPPATFNENIFHGSLAYYIFAPFYALSQGDPTLVSIFLRLYNAAGVFLIFLIATTLFNKKIGFLSALFFAFSYEQTQYALFLSHPPLAILTVLLFYIGLTKVIFQNNQKGLILILMGLGLSIQFHISMVFLFLILISALIIFRKKLPHFSIKIIILSFFLFLLTISTFIAAEYKYRDIINLLGGSHNESFINLDNLVPRTTFQVNRYIHDNILVATKQEFTGVIILLSLIILVWVLQNNDKAKIVFLVLWFFGGLAPYMITKSEIYYYGMGGSISLFILCAVLTYQLFSRSKVIGFLLLSIILISNMFLIISNNKAKFNQYIVVQEGLVIPKEKEALDYIYQKAGNQAFSVNAVMIPFNVKTTWDYLFNWYGQQKYGYVPIWGGNAAPGYEGVMRVETSRSALPQKRFVIIEPQKNIPSYLISDLLKEEDYFSKVIEIKNFGNITVQTRGAI